MPVVLRSRVKTEAESLSEEVSTSFNDSSSRRQRKRRRDKDSEEVSDSIASEDEGSRYSRHFGNNRPFEIIAGLPCSLESAQYNSALTHPLSMKDSAVLYDSLVRSRRTWVLGEMFELYFTKTNKPAKEAKPTKPDGSPQGMIMQVRDKMQKMCDCTMFGGPHTFPIRLFILKNDEIEKKWQEEQDTKKKEKEDRRKQEQEEKKRRVEEKKQQQQVRKQEREMMMQLQKENKAKAKIEQEQLKSKRKEEMKKAKEEHKRMKKTIPAMNKLSQPSLQHPRQNSPHTQSVTDPKMITNLNLMAQRDPKLNALMAIVAKGDATLDQVEEFKKFIEIAKKMAPQPGWTTALSPKRTPANETNTSKEKIETVKSTAPNISSEKKMNEKKIGKEASVSQILNDKDEDKSNGSKVEVSKDSEAIKKEHEGKLKTRRKKLPEANDEEKSMQLTAFQQKYIEGAQLILEYQEYTHSRYMLPKSAIIEYIESTGDFIISWIILHNKKEILRHRSKRVKEISKDLKTEAEIRSMTENLNVYSEQGCPTPLYSPMTVRISGVHKRFVPIVLNSVDAIEKTQMEMTAIIDIGTRLSGYNLWYQLDAYDDKELAENLRVGLNEHEQELKIRKPKK